MCLWNVPQEAVLQTEEKQAYYITELAVHYRRVGWRGQGRGTLGSHSASGCQLHLPERPRRDAFPCVFAE